MFPGLVFGCVTCCLQGVCFPVWCLGVLHVVYMGCVSPGVWVAGPLDSVKLFWFTSRNVTADPVFFVKLVWLAGCASV